MNGIYANLSVFVYPKVFPQPAGIQAVSRSDEELSLDWMTM